MFFCLLPSLTWAEVTLPQPKMFGTVTPAIATKQAWDSKFSSAGYSITKLPEVDGKKSGMAWHGSYWLRAYTSMAQTYGDTKYLDWAVRTIDYFFSQSVNVGWIAEKGGGDTLLETGVIANSIAQFSNLVWRDVRFAAYRDKADAYNAKLVPILKSYDRQWVDNAPFPGAPSFYVYMCGEVPCGKNSLLMYNQGAVMADAMLRVTDWQKLKGQAPDKDFINKADKAAAYFKTFATLTNGAYVWKYVGARNDKNANQDVEDINHGHIDVRLLINAYQHGLGGINAADLVSLGKTLTSFIGDGSVWYRVDGTGSINLGKQPLNAWDRVPIAMDWIDLAADNPNLFDKVVETFDKNKLHQENGSRFFLGMAEILRIRAGLKN